MKEIITLISCIAPIIEKKAKTTTDNYPSPTINARKNYDTSKEGCVKDKSSKKSEKKKKKGKRGRPKGI